MLSYFPLILTSPDALQWTALAESVPALVGSLKSVSYGNGGYVAIGETWFRDPTDPTRAWMMNAPLILNSPDGIHWTIEQSSIRKGKLNQIIYKDKNFIATGEAAIKRDNGDTDSLLTLTSADGIHWKSAFSEKKIS
jgi:hypothetical protein